MQVVDVLYFTLLPPDQRIFESLAGRGYNWGMRRPNNNRLIFQARILLDRLERLSADSSYAHRASGLRGAILRDLAAIEQAESPVDLPRLAERVAQAYEILRLAAQEIPEAD